jgi:hypothetical protein
MNWLHRDRLGEFLNECGLDGLGAEVGSKAGRFAAAVLAAWGGRGLTLVDPWEAQPPAVYADAANDPAGLAADYAAAARLAASDARVGLLRGYSPGAAGHFRDGSLDWVYLDGNHSYPAAAEDLRAWYPKVRPGGLFAGHDYLDGVVGGTLFGVKTAVDRFAAGVGLAAAFTTADPPFRSWYVRKPLGPPPPPGRVAVVTGYDPGYAGVGEVSRANKEAYCRRHGYRFVCRTGGFDPARPPAWSKVRFVLDELGRADTDWVFWSDADAVVMDPSVPVTRFVQDSADLVLSGDPAHGINTGHLLVRNTPWAAGFLSRVWDRTEFLHHPFWENSAVVRLYAEDPEVRRRAAVVPNKLFNGFPHPGGGYAAGDFLVHLAGVRRPALDAAIRSYAAMAG